MVVKMATTQDFIDYLYDQVNEKWSKRYRKMFGVYMFYINEKPILLVCENTVYVRMLECVSQLIPSDSKGFPYKGAKEHYIIDIDNT